MKRVVAHGFKFRVVRQDGRQRRWISWAADLPEARRIRDAQHVIDGYPVLIERWAGTRSGEDIV